MSRVLLSVSMFFIGGTLIASVVSGNPCPVIIGVVASIILWRIFGGMDDAGGGGGGCGGGKQQHNKRRKC